MFGLTGGAVQVPRWILIFRALQFLFAVVVIATTAYSLSIFRGGPIRPALIATIIIAILTIIPILLLITPLHVAQRRIFDPRIALLLDGFAALFWLASFTALASYHDIFVNYGRETDNGIVIFDGCVRCRKAWRSGVAATVFAAIEFLLFLFTSLTFIFYYHHHLAGKPAPGISSSRKNKAEAGTAAAAETGTGTRTGTEAVVGTGDGAGVGAGTGAGFTNGAGMEEHQMQTSPTHGHTNGQTSPHTNEAAPDYSVPEPPPFKSTNAGGGGTGSGIGGPPYPESPTVKPVRSGGY